MDDLPFPDVDQSGSRYRLWWIHRDIKQGKPLSDGDREWLASAMLSIAYGGDANKAFNLNPVGRKKRPFDDDYKIYEKVEDMMEVEGIGKKQACSLLGDSMRLDESTIRRAYNRISDTIDESCRIQCEECN